jgi:hypothetical protein
MHEPAPGPSSSGSVVLDLGPGIGALVLHTPPELDGREIEISPLGSTPARRTHPNSAHAKPAANPVRRHIPTAPSRDLHDMGKRCHPRHGHHHQQRPGDHHMVAPFAARPKDAVDLDSVRDDLISHNFSQL